MTERPALGGGTNGVSDFWRCPLTEIPGSEN